MKKTLKVKNKYTMPDSGPVDRELDDSLRRVRLPARSKYSYSERMHRKGLRRKIFLITLLFLLFILAYVFMSVLLDLTQMPLEETETLSQNLFLTFRGTL